MTSPVGESQKLAQDAKITLYRLDLSPFSEPDAYFSRHAKSDGTGVSFDGQVYEPIAMREEGFEWKSGGDEPTPKLIVARNSVTLLALLKSYDNLRGVNVHRLQTYRKHLDDGDDPDGTVHWPIEVFTVDRAPRPRDEPVIIVELATPVAQAAVKLPGRLVTRNYCPFTYRQWDPAADEGAGAFDYTHVFCPYDGEAFFDVDGNAVENPEDDRCGKQLRDCELRHPLPVKVPYGGFPGVARVRG